MKMNYARWFLGELDGLQAQELLTPEAAERLRAHYTRQATGQAGRYRELVLGVLGALLIGGGIILLLAHNWDELARPLRAFLALVPVVGSLFVAHHALTRKPASAAWRESSGTALTLAIAAAIALISQTYHLGDLDFPLTWALLTLPGVYVLRASVPALFYLVTSLSWAMNDGTAYGYWLLLAAVAPFVLAFCRRHTASRRAVLLAWCSALALPFALLAGNARQYLEETWFYGFGLLFAVMALEGMRLARNATPTGRNALALGGFVGVVVIALIASFRPVAEHLTRSGLEIPAAWADGRIGADEVTMWILLAALTLRLAVSLAGQWRKPRAVPALLAGLPLLALPMLIPGTPALAMVIAFNVYLALLTLTVMADGLRGGHAGWMNLGLAGFSALIVARFFEGDLPLAVRGLAFVVVGIAFLVVNMALARRGRQDPAHSLQPALGESS